jgi:hypothetical protein
MQRLRFGQIDLFETNKGRISSQLSKTWLPRPHPGRFLTDLVLEELFGWTFAAQRFKKCPQPQPKKHLDRKSVV